MRRGGERGKALELAGARVVIQGFGAVGSDAARALSDLDGTVIAAEQMAAQRLSKTIALRRRF